MIFLADHVLNEGFGHQIVFSLMITMCHALCSNAEAEALLCFPEELKKKKKKKKKHPHKQQATHSTLTSSMIEVHGAGIEEEEDSSSLLTHISSAQTEKHNSIINNSTTDGIQCPMPQFLFPSPHHATTTKRQEGDNF